MIKLKDLLKMTSNYTVILQVEYIYCDTEMVSGTVDSETIKVFEDAIVTEIEADNNDLIYHVLMIPADTEAEREALYKEWKEENI